MKTTKRRRARRDYYVIGGLEIEDGDKAGMKGEGQSQPQPCEVLKGAMSNTKVRIVHIRLLHYFYIILHIFVILYNLLQ